jgi:hypothetical protein
MWSYYMRPSTSRTFITLCCLKFEGRAVLNIDHPGPELKGSGRRGESGHVDNILNYEMKTP